LFAGGAANWPCPGSKKRDILTYLVTHVFVCNSTVYVALSIGKKNKDTLTYPSSSSINQHPVSHQYALVLKDIICIMKVSLPNQLTYHASIIQVAALSSVEHFYLQNGERRAATCQGKSAWKRVCWPIAEIYHCLGPIYFRCAYQMSYDSFLHLHDLLEVRIEEAAAKIQGYMPKELV
jgi:hypothetical protein